MGAQVVHHRLLHVHKISFHHEISFKRFIDKQRDFWWPYRFIGTKSASRL